MADDDGGTLATYLEARLLAAHVRSLGGQSSSLAVSRPLGTHEPLGSRKVLFAAAKLFACRCHGQSFWQLAALGSRPWQAQTLPALGSPPLCDVRGLQPAAYVCR